MPDRNPLHAQLLSSPPSDPVLVLKKQEYNDITHKVFQLEHKVNLLLLHDRLKNPPESGSHVIHKTHNIRLFPIKYQFLPPLLMGYLLCDLSPASEILRNSYIHIQYMNFLQQAQQVTMDSTSSMGIRLSKRADRSIGIVRKVLEELATAIIKLVVSGIS